MEKSSRYSELFKSADEDTNKRISQWWQYLDYTGQPRESLFAPARSPLFEKTDVIENRQLNPDHIQVLRNATINFAESTLPDFGLRYYEEDKKKLKASYSDTYLLNNTPPDHPDETDNLAFKKPLFNRQRNERRFSSAFESTEKSSYGHKTVTLTSTRESNEKRLSDDVEMNVRQRNLFNRKQKKRNFSDAFDFVVEKGDEVQNEKEEEAPQVDQIETNTSIPNQKRKNLFERKTKKRNFSSAFSDPPLKSPTTENYTQEIITKKNTHAAKHPEEIDTHQEEINNKHLEVSEHNSKHEELSSDTIKSFDSLLSSTRLQGNMNSSDVRKRMSLYHRRISHEENNIDIMRNVTNLVTQPTFTNFKIVNVQTIRESDINSEHLKNTPEIPKTINSPHTLQKSSIHSEKLSKISTKSTKTTDKNSEPEYETFSDIENTFDGPKNKNIFNRQKNDSEIEKSKNLSKKQSKTLSRRKSEINEALESEKSIIPEIEDENTDIPRENFKTPETQTLRKSLRHSKLENIEHSAKDVDQIEPADPQSLPKSSKKNLSRVSNRSRKTLEYEEDQVSLRKSTRNLSRSQNRSTKNIENEEDDTINTRSTTRKLSKTPNKSRKTIEIEEADIRRSRRNLSRTPNKSRKTIENDEEDMQRSRRNLSPTNIEENDESTTDVRRSKRNLSRTPNISRKTMESEEDKADGTRSRRNLSRSRTRKTMEFEEEDEDVNRSEKNMEYEQEDTINTRRSRRDLSRNKSRKTIENEEEDEDVNGSEKNMEYEQEDTINTRRSRKDLSRNKSRKTIENEEERTELRRSRRNLSQSPNKYTEIMEDVRKSGRKSSQSVNKSKKTLEYEEESEKEVQRSDSSNIAEMEYEEDIAPVERSKGNVSEISNKSISNQGSDSYPQDPNEIDTEETDSPNNPETSGTDQYLSQPESVRPQFTTPNNSVSRTLLSDLSKKYLDEARIREIKHRKISKIPESESETEIRKSQFFNTSRNVEENRTKQQNNPDIEMEIQQESPESDDEIEIRTTSKNRFRLQANLPESESEAEIRRSHMSNTSRNQTKNRYTLQENTDSDYEEVRRSQVVNISRNQSKNRFTLQENLPESENEIENRRSHVSNTSRNQSKSRYVLQEIVPELGNEAEIDRSHLSNISRSKNRSRIQENIPEFEYEPDIRGSQISNTSRNLSKHRSILQDTIPETQNEAEMRRSQVSNTSRNQSRQRFTLQETIPESQNEPETRRSQVLSISRNQSKNRFTNIPESENEVEIRRSQVSNISRNQSRNRFTLQETIPETQDAAEMHRSHISNTSRNQSRHRFTLDEFIPETQPEDVRRSNISRKQSKGRFTLQENIPESEYEGEIGSSQETNISRNQSKNRYTFQDTIPETQFSRNRFTQQENIGEEDDEVEFRRSQVSNITRNRSRNTFTIQDDNESEMRRSQVSNVSRNQNDNRSRLLANIPESNTEDEMKLSQPSKISKIPILQKTREPEVDNKTRMDRKLSGRMTNENDYTPEIETGQDIVERIENSRRSGTDSDIGSTHRSSHSRSSFAKNLLHKTQFTTDDYDSHISHRNAGANTKRYFELYEAPDRKNSSQYATSQDVSTIPDDEEYTQINRVDRRTYVKNTQEPDEDTNTKARSRIDRRTYTINSQEETDEVMNTSGSKFKTNRIDRRTFTKNTQEPTDEVMNSSRSRIDRRTFTKNSQEADEAVNISGSRFNRVDRRTYTINTQEETDEPINTSASTSKINRRTYTKNKSIELEKENELSSDEENFIMNLSKRSSKQFERNDKSNSSPQEIEEESNQENIQLSDIVEEVSDLQKSSKDISKSFNEHIRISRSKNMTIRGTEDMDQTKLRKTRETEETYSSDDNVFTKNPEILDEEVDDPDDVGKKVRNVTRRTLATIESDDFDINVHKNKEVTKNMTIRPNESMEQTKLIETSLKMNTPKKSKVQSPKSDVVTSKKKNATVRTTESMEQTLIEKSMTPRSTKKKGILSDMSVENLNSSISKNQQSIDKVLNPELSPFDFTEISRRNTRSAANMVDELEESDESPILSRRKSRKTESSNVQKSAKKTIESVQENKQDKSPNKTVEKNLRSSLQKKMINEETESTKHVEDLQKSINRDKSNIHNSVRRNLSHFLRKEDNAQKRFNVDNKIPPVSAKETKQNIEKIVDIIENYKGPAPESKLKMRKLDVLFERMREIQKTKKLEKTRYKTAIKKPLPPWKCMPNGEPIPKPKLFKSEKWMTKLFYRHLEKCLEPKFGIDNTLKAEKVMKKLGEVSKIVRKSKQYEGEVIEELKVLLARYGIVKTTYDFYFFIMDWLPCPLRERMVPMSLPKNHVAKIIVPKSTTSIMEKIIKETT